MNPEIEERLKKISERLKKEYHAEKVILFGSYARGEETEDNDLDILVSAPSHERLFERMATVLEMVSKIDKSTLRMTSIHSERCTPKLSGTNTSLLLSLCIHTMRCGDERKLLVPCGYP